MKRRGSVCLDLRIAGPGLCLLCAILTIPLIAQPAETHSPQTILGYDKAHEITLNGIVQETFTRHEADSPAGLHVVVNGPQGLVDAHLGPYMTKQTQEALKSGTPVQIVGAIERYHGKETLLARRLIFGGRLITVRNDRGFLNREQNGNSSHHHPLHLEASKGGAQ